MEYRLGQIVYSKSGHDKGEVMMVIALADNYVYLANGKTRRLAKPKRKKIIHIQPTHYVDADIAGRLQREEYLLDADIKKALKLYQVNALDC